MVLPPLRVAVLVKQVPRFTDLALSRGGRLARDGVGLELNPFCRRAVAQAVQLARVSGGRCVALTLGPPAAEDSLREAVACGADAGVLITDPAFAGSDTLATARALAAAVRRAGPFDLILCGRNSVDAETGQVPAQLAELLGLPLAAGVRELAVLDHRVRVRCEHDDGWWQADVRLPALLTCAERLTAPAKADPAARAAVDPARISRLDAATLGAGPWGDAGSPTEVGEVAAFAVDRARQRFPGAPADQVREAVAAIARRGVFDTAQASGGAAVPVSAPAVNGRLPNSPIAVLIEPESDRTSRELLGAAAVLGHRLGRPVAALACAPLEPGVAGSRGADTVYVLDDPRQPSARRPERETATAFADWCVRYRPWAVLAPSTTWGREIAGRIAARCGHGLVGDAVDLRLDTASAAEPVALRDARLVCDKPAFGGAFLASVTCRSDTQMVTLRPGVLPLLEPRSSVADQVAWPVPEPVPRGGVSDVRRTITDDPGALTEAAAVVCVGAGVPPDEYALLDPLLKALGAELAATRKVADRDWQPRSRQVGITGRSVGPRLYVCLGVHGSSNHMIGTRRAHTILAVDEDPAAPVFDAADFGIVADWRVAVPLLVTQIERARRQAVAALGTESGRRA